MCKESGGEYMRIGEAISKSIDKSKEVGKKVKEYMVDDTAKDLKKIFETDKKKDPHSHLEKFKESGDGLLYCSQCNAWHKGNLNWDDDSEGK